MQYRLIAKADDNISDQEMTGYSELHMTTPMKHEIVLHVTTTS
jgi:hypothetical protein